MEEFNKFCKKLENEKELKIKRIISDHGEFKNLNFMKFCDEKIIVHEFPNAKTPQQNSIVERKKKHCYIFLEQCWLKIIFSNIFGQKPSIWFVII